MKRELIKTEDGSHTLYIKEMDEQYHSIHGAIQESNHVFIEAGLSIIDLEEITIFEAGFGTGLNAYLTWEYAKQHNKKIHFVTIELYPIENEIIPLLNYASLTKSNNQEIFNKLHLAKWDTTTQIDQYLTITKFKQDLTTFNHLHYYDLVYFDAFGPDKQPQLWTDEIFERIAAKTNKNGVLVTYSAKGVVRRSIIKSGFEVERIPGPPGKRQMMRGRKI